MSGSSFQYVVFIMDLHLLGSFTLSVRQAEDHDSSQWGHKYISIEKTNALWKGPQLLYIHCHHMMYFYCQVPDLDAYRNVKLFFIFVTQLQGLGVWDPALG